ncbi:succinate dehydrogenase and fumarate reductase iron-sulfur protein [Chloroherpeton thalassium ATCC 35110]|uniref:Fumarate reductase iron-sulfur subunit n=1 Tax=Chloroherpeton thalassium (strain ATCC 35110 / GB-78) TaxID=517418 RepID=B3QSZ2_CHLT3|nr:succinate dehydrogenase/fumarate reductase iron-sulfur subunit [Chloroherpeton thalassium]ACF12635.1 succinate dehydrogenase and fumarate reductase iron-sulfur protein [Chloroherpeton thalassium ATCC 35110]
MKEVKAITFRVFRFNPQIDEHPYYDSFEIPTERGITVLRALDYIKQNLEPRLSFSSFCHAGICGSCSMKINGMAKLACTTQVWDELKNSVEKNVITVEPINNLPALRDLIVDMQPLVRKLETYLGWVEPAMPEQEMGKKECTVSEEEFRVYDPATDCILCGTCLSDCPALKADPDYVSPPVLLRSFRMNADSRDKSEEERLELLGELHGVMDCRGCNRCAFTCVKNIPIMQAIQSLRERVMQKKLSGKS